ncbi:GNAT family N-acetyltransferase [Spongiimicrobium salis]|uniref:GNAT family N-acetyltransferase n=1 Tax=Spongiimicrobium salis TaxID=1667022 RepID=UPI00374D90A0
MVHLVEAKSDKDYKIAIQLFKEYAVQIGIDLSFQNFDREILDIEKQYSKPTGQLILAYDATENPIGCFGVRKFSDSICELKRMYVRKAARGKGIGKELLVRAMEVGKALNYQKMRLDTLSTMESAIALYKKVGFYEIQAYRFNPIEGAKCFEIQL